MPDLQEHVSRVGALEHLLDCVIGRRVPAGTPENRRLRRRVWAFVHRKVEGVDQAAEPADAQHRHLPFIVTRPRSKAGILCHARWRRAIGVAQKRLRKDDVATISISLPPLEVQRQMARSANLLMRIAADHAAAADAARSQAHALFNASQ